MKKERLIEVLGIMSLEEKKDFLGKASVVFYKMSAMAKLAEVCDESSDDLYDMASDCAMAMHCGTEEIIDKVILSLIGIK